jgi:hypothetical protein
MRIRNVALSIAALAGLVALTPTPSRAVANEGALAGMFIADANPDVLTIGLVANPGAAPIGAPVFVTFSPAGCTEKMIVGCAPLSPTITAVPVPNPAVAGEYGTSLDSELVRYDPGND